MKSLEENIGYTFKNKELLKRALTHTSYAYEKGVQSNEKLEFLGDSILEFISSIYIYQNYPTLKEGEMTKVRATVVCEDSLYKIATRLKFNEFLYLGNSEIKGKEQIRKAILADSVEAVIAAMYLDSNLEEAQRFIIDNLKNEIDQTVSTLSDGQKQRVAIIRAIVTNPKLLLCDEPTGNLDMESTKIVMDTLKQIKEEFKTTIVVVTHNVNILDYFDKVYEIKDGKIL